MNYYTRELVLRRVQTTPPGMGTLLFGVVSNAVGNGNDEWVRIRIMFFPKRHFKDGDLTTLIGSPL
jgi:hypothetical protein